MLRPQDILLTLKFLSPMMDSRSSYVALAESLSLSSSETHAAVRRALRSGLLIRSVSRTDSLFELRPSIPSISEILCYGVGYFLPVESGRFALGIPTAESAPPLAMQFSLSDAPAHVWPHPRGSLRGLAVEPLYPSAPDAALRDPILAEWLALTDALRLHTGRIADLAKSEVRKRLREFSHAAAA